MISVEESQLYELHQPRDQLSQIPSPANPSMKQKDTSHAQELRELQQIKLPLKLPQLYRTKFFTSAEANSASYGIQSNVNVGNSASVCDKLSSQLESQKASDLLLAMAESKEEAVEQMRELITVKEDNPSREVEKEKLLRELEQDSVYAVAEFQSKSKTVTNSSLNGSSSLSRIGCRVCGKVFPSGRALGGHMRVHASALLMFSDSTSANLQDDQQKGYGELQNLGSADHGQHSEAQNSSRKNVQGRVHEETKPRSFTSSSTSCQVSSEKLRHHLDNKHQEAGDDSYEEDDEKVGRMVNLSSLECSSMISLKPALDEAVADGVKKTVPPLLYELRRNPKPNRRFMRDQELARPNSSNWPPPQVSSGQARRSPSPSPEGACPCSECGKVFLSWKALFGHMRCHPERDWRGIQPPEQRIIELNQTARGLTSSQKPMLPELSLATDNSITAASDSSTHVVVGDEPTIRKQEAIRKLSIVSFTVADDEAFGDHLTNLAPHIRFPHNNTETAAKLEQVDEQEQEAITTQCTIKRHRPAKRAADHIADWWPSWPSTRKRSRRNHVPSGHALHERTLTSEATHSKDMKLNQTTSELIEDQEDLDMANCLVLLSGAKGNMHDESKKEAAFLYQGKKQRPLSDGSALWRSSKDGAAVHNKDNEAHGENDRDDVPNKVNAVANHVMPRDGDEAATLRLDTEVKYQCSTCRKCFNSHQALGGHRASHRKTKGCFAQTNHSAKELSESIEEHVAEVDNGNTGLGMDVCNNWQIRMQETEMASTPVFKKSPKKKLRGHECSICHRVFASGQALGGHKRCHWNGERYTADTLSIASSNNNNNNSSSKQSSLQDKSEWGCRSTSTVQARMAKEDVIDLNLPAPLDEDDELRVEASTGQEQMFGGLWSSTAERGHAIVGSMVDSLAGAARKQLSEANWMVNDLLGARGGHSSFLHATREVEASRCRLDGRPPMWNQRWDNTVVAQIPQICSLQPL